MLLGFFRKVLFVEHYKRHIWSTRCWNEGGSLTVRASRNCTWHQVSAARHPDTHKDMIWVCAVAAGLFEFVLLWIFCCEVGSVVLTHLLCIGAVHNLVQVSCYGSCSGSHHEVKTLWGPAMVHQSPVCRLTPHLFLGKSYGVVGPGWGRWPWLIHGPNGYDYPLLTIHSICIANTEKVGTCSCGCFESNWFSCMRTRHLGRRFLRFTHFPRMGVKLMMVLGCAGSCVKLALPQLQ